MTHGASQPTLRDAAPKLLALTDRGVATAAETLRRFERVARAARPWSVVFQLRDRELPATERLVLGRQLRALCNAEEQWFQVNDRLDLAVLLGADGVHLGEASVTAADARRVVGPAAFISRACHEPDGVLEPGVDAWVLSPIFGVRKGRAALGAAALTRLRDRCRAAGQGATAPLVLALGGVTAPVAKAALRAGADGVAVIGAVLSSDRVESLLSELEIAR